VCSGVVHKENTHLLGGFVSRYHKIPPWGGKHTKMGRGEPPPLFFVPPGDCALPKTVWKKKRRTPFIVKQPFSRKLHQGVNTEVFSKFVLKPQRTLSPRNIFTPEGTSLGLSAPLPKGSWKPPGLVTHTLSVMSTL